MVEEKTRFLRIRDMSEIELFRTTGSPQSVPRHIHWVFSISITEQGERCHETRHSKYLVPPGSVLIVNVGEVHSAYASGTITSTRAIRIQPELLTKIIAEITGKTDTQVSLSEPVIQDLFLARQISQLHVTLEKAPLLLEKEIELLNVFARLYERYVPRCYKETAQGQETGPIAKSCEYLQDCYASNISLENLSAVAGLSPFHLLRIFTQKMGVSPHVYQQQLRLNKANNLLALGNPITEVALATGFYDQSHFQRFYKKKFGITPGQYNR